MLGVRVLAREDPFEKLSHGTAEPSKMVNLSSDCAIDPRTWPLEYWWPFGGCIPWRSMPWHIRICPACARYCYHSMLFQVPGVRACPWHRVALIESCPRCSEVLFGPQFDTGPLGACRCGHDLVDYTETVLGDSDSLVAKHRAIALHIASACTSRSATYLVTTEAFDPFAWQALDRFSNEAFASPWRARVESRSSDELIFESIVARKTRCRKWCTLPYDIDRDFRSTFSLSLPTVWQKSLTQIFIDLTDQIPLTVRKRLASEPHLLQIVRDLSPYRGIGCVHLPVQHIQPLALAVLNNLVFETTTSKFFKTHPLAGPLVRRAYERLLYRAYAAAILGALGPQVAPYGVGKPWPTLNKIRDLNEYLQLCRTRYTDEIGRRFPWVLLCLPEGRPPSALIAWTRQSDRP